MVDGQYSLQKLTFISFVHLYQIIRKPSTIVDTATDIGFHILGQFSFLTSSLPLPLGVRWLNSALYCTSVTPVVLETSMVTLTAMTSICNPRDSLVTVAMDITNQLSFCTSVIKSFPGDRVCVYIYLNIYACTLEI